MTPRARAASSSPWFDPEGSIPSTAGSIPGVRSVGSRSRSAHLEARTPTLPPSGPPAPPPPSPPPPQTHRRYHRHRRHRRHRRGAHALAPPPDASVAPCRLPGRRPPFRALLRAAVRVAPPAHHAHYAAASASPPSHLGRALRLQAHAPHRPRISTSSTLSPAAKAANRLTAIAPPVPTRRRWRAPLRPPSRRTPSPVSAAHIAVPPPPVLPPPWSTCSPPHPAPPSSPASATPSPLGPAASRARSPPVATALSHGGDPSPVMSRASPPPVSAATPLPLPPPTEPAVLLALGAGLAGCRPPAGRLPAARAVSAGSCPYRTTCRRPDAVCSFAAAAAECAAAGGPCLAKISTTLSPPRCSVRVPALSTHDSSEAA